MEEYTQPEGEVHLEPSRENRLSEQPGVQSVSKKQRKRGKEKQQEEEEDEFVSEEAYSIWKKYYAGKGFVGEQKTINRGDLTEEAKVWFYFLASVMASTKHVCMVREQEAIILYAMLKGYKLNTGAIIENSIMRYHEGNKRGLIPHPTTITKLCLRAGVKGT